MSLHNPPFDFAGRCNEHDRMIASRFIGSLYRPPDLIIAPAGHGEYLFRWYVVPRNKEANVYFHVQTQSDPERPLHDHPWDSTSAILAGGYDEIVCEEPWICNSPIHYQRKKRKPGDVIFRPASWAHRLILPVGVPYSMSLFSTGPKVRDWGFWDKNGFIPFSEVTVETNGHSSWKRSMAE